MSIRFADASNSGEPPVRPKPNWEAHPDNGASRALRIVALAERPLLLLVCSAALKLPPPPNRRNTPSMTCVTFCADDDRTLLWLEMATGRDGHEDIRLTLGTYRHLFPEAGDARKPIAAFDAAVFGNLR